MQIAQFAGSPLVRLLIYPSLALLAILTLTLNLTQIPTSPNYYPLTESPDTSPAPAPGIRTAGAGFVSDEAPVMSSIFYSMLNEKGEKPIHIANEWWKVTGDRSLIVLAGSEAKRFDPEQGKLVIITVEHKTQKLLINYPTYLTPGRHGYIRVTDAVGERLTLKAQDGTFYYFDLPTLSWANP